MDSHTVTAKLESQQPNAGTSYSETTFLVIDPVTRQVDISRCPQIQAHGLLVNFAASRAVHDIDCCKYVHIVVSSTLNLGRGTESGEVLCTKYLQSDMH